MNELIITQFNAHVVQKLKRSLINDIKEYPIIPLNRTESFNELNNDLYRLCAQLAGNGVASIQPTLIDTWELGANKVNE